MHEICCCFCLVLSIRFSLVRFPTLTYNCIYIGYNYNWPEVRWPIRDIPPAPWILDLGAWISVFRMALEII